MPVLTNAEGDGIWTVPGRRRVAATAGARVVFWAHLWKPASDLSGYEWAILSSKPSRTMNWRSGIDGIGRCGFLGALTRR